MSTSSKTSDLLTDPQSLMLLSAAILMITANNAISPALPGLEAQFQDTPHAGLIIRFLVSAPSLTVAIFAPFTGRLVDSLGRRPILAAGAALFAFAGCAGAVLPELWMILGSRLLLGVAVAMIMTAQSALIGDRYAGGARNRFVGLQTSVRNFGGLAFILIAGQLASLSPRLPFLVYGLGALQLPLYLLVLKAPDRELAATGTTGNAGPIHWPHLLGISAAAMTTTLLFFVMPTQTAFLAQSLGLDPARSTGWVLGALMVAGGPAALGYATLVTRIGRSRVLALGYLAMAAGFALLRTGQMLPDLMIAAALIGAGYGLVTPAFLPMVLDRTHASRRGVAAGVLTTGLYFGQVLSPFVSQPVVQVFGWSVLLSGTALILLGLAAITCLMQWLPTERQRQT